MPAKTVTITVSLQERDARALAQFVKRVGWSEFRQNAVDDNEAYEIRAAISAVQNALDDIGYSPR